MRRPSCHRRGCSRIRSEFGAFLSRRHTPRFRGHYFCTESCLSAHLEHELTERWRILQRETEQGIRRLRLGTILLEDGIITQDQLLDALVLQQETRSGRLGEWLIRLGFAEERDITMAISRQYGIPAMSLAHLQPRIDAVRMIPGAVARRAGLMPVSFDDPRDALRVAVTGPVDFQCLDAIRRMLKKGVLAYVGDESHIRKLLDQWYPVESEPDGESWEIASMDDLRGALRDLVRDAAEERAENVEAELLAGFLWIRMDKAVAREHRILGRCTSPARPGMPEAQLVPTGTY